MSVCVVFPSKKAAEDCQETIDLWRSRGYLVAVWRDTGDAPVLADVVLTGEYPGYARACNALCRAILEAEPSCGWCIPAGDDIEPDPTHSPDSIARELEAHFGGTFGVMQPTGDRWGECSCRRCPNCIQLGGGAYADRVCGSAFVGREFCERMYGGNGPLFEGYFHMWVDSELQELAIKLGVLWQRRDLVHFHRHWGRTPGSKAPAYLAKANSPQHWQQSKAMFESRRALGFPGYEPVSVSA